MLCVCVLRRLKHDNLMDMVGFSCDGQYPCVVYPLMPNGSLLDRLACLVSPHLAMAAGFGALSNIISPIFLLIPQEGNPPLSWKQRCLIAEGTANGLEYLHRNHHVHRDVKR